MRSPSGTNPGSRRSTVSSSVSFCYSVGPDGTLSLMTFPVTELSWAPASAIPTPESPGPSSLACRRGCSRGPRWPAATARPRAGKPGNAAEHHDAGAIAAHEVAQDNAALGVAPQDAEPLVSCHVADQRRVGLRRVADVGARLPAPLARLNSIRVPVEVNAVRPYSSPLSATLCLNVALHYAGRERASVRDVARREPTHGYLIDGNENLAHVGIELADDADPIVAGGPGSEQNLGPGAAGGSSRAPKPPSRMPCLAITTLSL
jgi:hypothetical protein